MSLPTYMLGPRRSWNTRFYCALTTPVAEWPVCMWSGQRFSSLPVILSGGLSGSVKAVGGRRSVGNCLEFWVMTRYSGSELGLIDSMQIIASLDSTCNSRVLDTMHTPRDKISTQGMRKARVRQTSAIR